MRTPIIFILLIGLSFTTGCEYQKVLKKGTLTEKLDVARKYYNKGDYPRAQILLEQLIGKFGRGSNAEEVYFLYSYCHFGMNDYALASYHFQNFVERYPLSTYHEQAAFMVARCEFESSLVSELDQTNTKKAMEAIQLFINRYPKSSSIQTGNEMIDQLRARLHDKAFRTAMLYYNMESYLSAYTSFKTAIIEYPDIPNKEEVEFYVVKSAFLYAKQSVSKYQEERFSQALEDADEYTASYTKNKFTNEIGQIKKECNDRIQKLKETQTAQ